MADVAILRCESYDSPVYKTVSKALDLIHAEDFCKRGMKVLIKPNIVSPSNPSKAATTHPAIIDAICKYVSRFDAKIFIGDSSGLRARHGTARAFKESGVAKVAKKWSAQLIDFDKETRAVIRNGNNATVLKNIAVPKTFAEMDLIINACKLKTHMFMGYSGAVKNMFGILPGRAKVNAHVMGGNVERFSNILIDVYLAVKPKISIMDAIIGMEGNGPVGGRRKKTGLVLVSKDAISLDIVASKIIGFKPHELELLKTIKKRNLAPNKIKIIGCTDGKTTYKKANAYRGWYSRIFQFMIERQQAHFVVDKGACEKCGGCIAICPQKAIKANGGYPEFNPKKCIMCHSCYKACPLKAIVLRKPLAARLINKFTKRFED